jgi:transcriptional regulator with XRE-family HTH domain
MFNAGERVAFLRKGKNISLSVLAKKAGIAQSSLSYIESGTNKPTIDTIEKICNALGISLLEFFDIETENSHTPPDITTFSADKNNYPLIRLVKSIKAAGYSDEIIEEWLKSLFANLEKTRISFIGYKPPKEDKEKIERFSEKLKRGKVKVGRFQTPK